MAKGHSWSGWPGAYCLRCGAEHVLETAIGEGWLSFGPGPDGKDMPDEWKSEDHKKLVKLCDETCYADLTPEERERHGKAIKELSDKLGLTENKDAGEAGLPKVP